MAVAMFQWQLVVGRASGNHDVCRGSRDPFFATATRQYFRAGPNLFVDRIKPQFLFQFLKGILFNVSLRSVPKLHQRHVAPRRIATRQQCFNALAGGTAASAQEFNPTGSVHQCHLAASHLRSSRICRRSSCVMKLGQEPCKRSASSSSRRRRLNSVKAVTTASRLVFAPVCLMASRSDLSGISIVVFMLPKYFYLESCQLHFGILKLFQEPHVVFVEEADVVDAVDRKSTR